MSAELKLPQVGFGTSQIPNNKIGVDIVTQALMCGYRLLDTAQTYGNERIIGESVRIVENEQGIKRKDLIISSKLMNESQGYYSTLRAFDETLNQLRLDYLDIYLIHWPIPRGKEKIYKELNIETWMAMEKLKEM